ncbi:MAG: transcription antitermination factor NusB [Bdellovibrionales bacterium]|nr:transcription antitermination factor NusB [Bdellovibrionales bacterium]
MGVRRQAREGALQALFMCDFLQQWDIDSVRFCFDHFAIPTPAQTFALRLCEGVIEHLAAIDSRLTCASENWSLSRMGRVDRGILRLATFEIVHLDEVPINVAINEAIEIAKRFGAEESPVFVNGVLDKVASTVRSQLQVEVVKQQRTKKVDDTTVEPAVAVDELDLVES